MTTEPLVSVCVPTYNRASWLREHLKTLCQQTYRTLEIVVCDNSSTDETETICRQALAQDPRMRYWRHPQHIGLYANHNFAIERSRGEFLGFFHDDDLYDASMVSEYLAFLQRHPDVGLVCADWELIDEEEQVMGQRVFRGPAVVPGLEYIEQTIRTGRSSLNCPGTMIRRSALGAVQFDESGPIGFGDFVVWFEVAERANVGHLPRTLWQNRIHRRAMSWRTVVGLADDYATAISRYQEGYLQRWPGEAKRVKRWTVWMHQFLFWALAYEVGRYFRRSSGGQARGGSARTVFDFADYHLSEEEFDQAMRLLKVHQVGWIQGISRAAIHALIGLRCPQPLAWASAYAPVFQGLWRR